VTFTYSARDPLGAVSSTITSTVLVNCTNDLPTAQSITATMTGNTLTSSGRILTRTLSGSDVETSNLLFTLVTPPLGGVVNLTLSGNLSYTPALGFSGSDSITFITNDGTANSISASITICVISPT
jgi:Bacterial Ig domain